VSEGRGQAATVINSPVSSVVETQVLIEEARQRQKRRHIWIGSVLTLAVALGCGLFFTVSSFSTHAVSVSKIHRGGPMLAGNTGLHIDIFVGRTAYELNLNNGEVRSAVPLPYDGLPASPNGYEFGPAGLEYIATAGGVFLPESARGGFVVSDDLQTVHSLSITSRPLPEGSTSRWALGSTPKTLIAFTEIERTNSEGEAYPDFTTEREVTTQGTVLFTRTLHLPPTMSRQLSYAPISQAANGDIVVPGSGGLGGSPIELVDEANGSIVRSLGYGGDAILGGDHLVWIGSTQPSKEDVPSPLPDALHITDLRTGADTVVPAPMGFIPSSFVISPDDTKVAVGWGAPTGDAASLGIVDLNTGAMKLVPNVTDADDPGDPVWAPGSRWLVFQTQGPGVGFGISAYKLGAGTVDPLSLPSYVNATANVTIGGHFIPALTEFHAFTVW